MYSLPVTIFDGPQIENNQTGGNSFTLSGLNLSVTSNNPSALSVRHLSNMLINGSITRATPLILPEPVIHGFSEIVTNGGQTLPATVDLLFIQLKRLLLTISIIMIIILVQIEE